MGEPAERYAGRILDLAGLLAEPRKSIPWRCQDFAADGYLTMLTGRGKEGKTWLALALAEGVAHGQPAAGINCAKGTAIVFDAENGRELIKERFHLLGVAGDCEIVPVEAGGLHFARDLEWFKETIVERGANLVIFDSLRVLSSGLKENDGDAMEPVITALKRLARSTGAAIVLIHHRGKGESDYRGTSTILDQVDAMFRLETVEGDPESATRRRLVSAGIRFTASPAPRWVEIRPNLLKTSVRVVEAEPFDGKRERPRDELRPAVEEELTDVPRSQASIARAVGRDPKDQSVRRVLQDLEEEGHAAREVDGWRRGVSGSESLGGGAGDTPSRNGAVEPIQGGVRGNGAGTPSNLRDLVTPEPPLDLSGLVKRQARAG